MVRAASTTENRDPAPPTLAAMNRIAGAKDGGLGVWSSAPTALVSRVQDSGRRTVQTRARSCLRLAMSAPIRTPEEESIEMGGGGL